MILFKKLRWQNMLSTGNQFTEVDLNRSKSTLIVGENGAGKSTILDALSFVLYGKPFRDINKPQLVNAMTGKNLLVEIDFSIGNKEYMIRRGMKPTVFEVFLNGQMINQSASMTEYQEMLEKNILKMNHKSFNQVVVLGSANYVPFMQLKAWERRPVVEDLLDIQIFSIMNSLLKDKISSNKSDVNENDHRIALLEKEIELQEKHVYSLIANNDELIRAKQGMIDELMSRIIDAELQAATLSTEVEKLATSIDDSAKVNARRTKLMSMESELENKIRKLRKEIQFFHDNDSCPTCRQGIEHEFKNERIESRQDQFKNVEDALTKIETDIQNLDARITQIASINVQITDLNGKISGFNSDIRSWQSSIKTLLDEIETIKNNTSQITVNGNEIDTLKKNLQNENSQKEKLLAHREVLDVASVLLKDTGIKTKIIRQYVPIINKLVNKYLAALDFFVAFELDEKFNETIKSRHRDDFSYASFSEGEKMRIDLSLMFTWRAIAKLRNSASTNLLIMDEVFDSSLDAGGTEEFLKILEGLTADSNVFIISHKGDQLYDKFHSVIRFEKHKNFSRIAA